MMTRWRAALIHALGGVVLPRRGSFTVQATIERGENLRVGYDQPTPDQLWNDDGSRFRPRHLPGEEFRPSRHL